MDIERAGAEDEAAIKHLRSMPSGRDRPMSGPDHLAYYTCQGRFTDPEEYAHLFDGLPAGIPALCRVVQDW